MKFDTVDTNLLPICFVSDNRLHLKQDFLGNLPSWTNETCVKLAGWYLVWNWGDVSNIAGYRYVYVQGVAEREVALELLRMLFSESIFKLGDTPYMFNIEIPNFTEETENV